MSNENRLMNHSANESFRMIFALVSIFMDNDHSTLIKHRMYFNKLVLFRPKSFRLKLSPRNALDVCLFQKCCQHTMPQSFWLQKGSSIGNWQFWFHFSSITLMSLSSAHFFLELSLSLTLFSFKPFNRVSIALMLSAIEPLNPKARASTKKEKGLNWPRRITFLD